MRKIYNEVIIDMNPLSPTFGDILYEDSFDYGGPLMSLAGECICEDDYSGAICTSWGVNCDVSEEEDCTAFIAQARCVWDPGADPVLGCMNDAADNYDPAATEDDGSCTYPASSNGDGECLCGDEFNGNICVGANWDATNCDGQIEENCTTGQEGVDNQWCYWEAAAEEVADPIYGCTDDAADNTCDNNCDTDDGSCTYSGELAVVCGSGDTANACCAQIQFFIMDGEDYLRMTGLGANCGEGWTKVKLTHKVYDNNDAFDADDHSCCVRNTVTTATFTNQDGQNTDSVWYEKVPFCDTPLHPDQCKRDDGTDWLLTTLNLGGYSSRPNKFDGSGGFLNWICAKASTIPTPEINYDGCTGFGLTTVTCNCPYTGASTCDNVGDGCIVGAPCGGNATELTTFCDTNTMLGGEIESCNGYSCHCATVDECGICGGTGIADGECDCYGNVEDVCGYCMIFPDIDISDSHMETEGIELVSTDGGIGTVYFGVDSAGVQIPKYENGIQGGFNAWFCTCSTDPDTGFPDDPQTIRQCIDNTTGVLSEDPISIYVCDSLMQTCVSYGYLETGDVAEAYDTGCIDPGACNYNSGYEKDCSNVEYLAGWDGLTDEQQNQVDKSCCVYPTDYCVADGSSYNASGLSAEVIDVVGNNNFCDVDISGNPSVTTYCPRCDGTDQTFVVAAAPYEITECGNFGYTEAAYNDMNIAGPAGATLGQVSIALLIAGDCDASNHSNYCIMYGGMFDGIGDNMLDTCSGASCGYAFNETGPGYSVTGCADPAALNFGDNQPLYWTTDFPANLYVEVENGVETCQYCPNSPDTYCDHPNGYEFHFTTNFSPYNATSAAEVTAGSGWSGGYFHLTSESQVLDQNVITGACFCKTDLQFIRDLISLNPEDSGTHPLQYLSAASSMQVWSERGRLTQFKSGGDNCQSQPDECRGYHGFGDMNDVSGPDGTPSNPIPTTIGDLAELEILDLSYGYLTGDIPVEIEKLDWLYVLDLSYNWLSKLDHTIHNVSDAAVAANPDDINAYSGLCRQIYWNYHPGNYNPYWLKLNNNRICPHIESEGAGTTLYPDCLVPPVGTDAWYNLTYDQQQWIWENLGFIELPTPDFSEYNFGTDDIPGAQDIMVDGELICDVSGCTDARAKNYWPEATESCGGGSNSCCQYDRFLHFPFSAPGGNPFQPLDGGGPLVGSYGGGMTKEQLVEALHADVYGFQYNAWGDLDVTGYPINFQGECEYEYFLAANGYLPMNVINNCNITFSNGNEYPIGNEIVDHWDGMWLRDSGYVGNGTCFTGNLNVWGEQETCYGDARPLEFIQRIEYEASFTGDPAGFKSYWFNQYFPFSGLNLSMQNIVYFEDYDQNGDGDLVNDIPYWNSIGRYDIVQQINWFSEGVLLRPEDRPEDYELWEQATVNVSMSYSQNFVFEEDAGFTLYGDEPGSAGMIHRSGQWVCSDGGDSTVCYQDLYSCGRAPFWVEECTPCGNGGGTCVPLTITAAAEGYEKITKTKTMLTPYFFQGELSQSARLLSDNIYTASISSSNHPYYYSIISGNPNQPGSELLFDVAWGHYVGSGSNTKSNTIKGTSEVIYKQYASLLLDDKLINNGFLISSGSDVRANGVDGDKDRWIYILNFRRKKFGNNLSLHNWELVLSGSRGGNGKTIHLTDDGLTTALPIKQTDGYGRRFNIISGSFGTPAVANQGVDNRYGFFYPDMGIMVFGEKLSNEFSGSNGTLGVGNFNTDTNSSNQLYPLLTTGSDAKNSLRFINCMKNVNIDIDGHVSASLTLYSEKEVTEVIFICRLSAENFNFTNNFTILSGSGRTMIGSDTGVLDGFNTSFTSSAFTSSGAPSSLIYTGGPGVDSDGTMETATVLEDGQTPFIWPGSNVTTMYGNPHTFITGVELYDEHGECLVTARPSKPIKKSFNREVVIKVKLRF